MEDSEVDREKATVPDSTSGDANSIQGLTGRLAECNIVDQERHTVEDPAGKLL